MVTICFQIIVTDLLRQALCKAGHIKVRADPEYINGMDRMIHLVRIHLYINYTISLLIRTTCFEIELFRSCFC